ncbi:hypothetical protein Tco_0482170 [Tanacetum coccineum]
MDSPSREVNFPNSQNRLVFTSIISIPKSSQNSKQIASISAESKVLFSAVMLCIVSASSCAATGNRLMKKGITMAEPNEYISVTRKNFISDDNKGRMIEKRAASEWFKKDYIGSVTTWGNLVEKFIQKFYQLFVNNEEMEADDPDNIAKIFKITGIKTYEEYELNNNMTGDPEEPWLDNGDHKWYDELADGVLKEEALIHKAKFEESWGDATPEVMKFCAWNYGANNAGNTQDSQEHKKEHHDPSICQVRRFDMMKYSFDIDDDYMAIKEHEHLTIQDPTLTHVKLIENVFALRMKDGLICCNKIDKLVMVYSGKRRVLNLYGHSDASSTHFCSRTQLENHPEQNIRGVPGSNSISHFL